MNIANPILVPLSGLLYQLLSQSLSISVSARPPLPAFLSLFLMCVFPYASLISVFPS